MRKKFVFSFTSLFMQRSGLFTLMGIWWHRRGSPGPLFPGKFSLFIKTTQRSSFHYSTQTNVVFIPCSTINVGKDDDITLVQYDDVSYHIYMWLKWDFWFTWSQGVFTQPCIWYVLFGAEMDYTMSYHFMTQSIDQNFGPEILVSKFWPWRRWLGPNSEALRVDSWKIHYSLKCPPTLSVWLGWEC